MLRGTLIATSIVAVAAFIVLVPSASAQESAPCGNDCFGGAEAVTQPLYQNVTNAGATMEAGEPQPCGPIGASRWYTFTASQPGKVVVSTVAEVSSLDSVLAAYTGSTLSGLTLVACNDQAVGDQAQIAFSCVAGTTYRIQLAGWLGETGETALTISGCGTVKVPSEPLWNEPTNDGRGVALSWERPLDDGGAPIMRYVLLRSVDGGPETVIASDLGPFRTLYLDEGVDGASFVDYRIRAANAIGTGAHSKPLHVYFGCFMPTNDCLDSATDLGTQRPADFSASTVGATLEVGEPLACGGAGKTVWHKFTAQTAGHARLRTTGPAEAWSVVTVYEAPVSEWSWITCSDVDEGGQASWSFPCVAGRTYFIQVASAIGDQGDLPFRLEGCGAATRGVTTSDPVVVRDHEYVKTGNVCPPTQACRSVYVDADTRVTISTRGLTDPTRPIVEYRNELVVGGSASFGSGETRGLVLGPPRGPGPGGTPTVGQVVEWARSLLPQ